MISEGQATLAQRLTGIDQVECITPDLNGIARGKVMTADGFLEGRRLQLASGVLLQCIMGGYPEARFYGADDGDLALVPDTAQLHRLPWSDEPRALVICDAEQLSGGCSPLSTRGLLKAVLARYAAYGLAPVVATELEFYVFAPNPDPAQPFRTPRGLDGRQDDGGQAFSVSSHHGLRPFFSEVYRCMAALGLPRDTVMHEMGIGQYEINLLHGDALLLADQTLLFKHLLKEVALKHGLTVVCMAKPLARSAGSSMHIHQSVVHLTNGNNVFSDAQGQPTETFHHFIGGQQAAMADFTALFAPNVNSYQRLCNPYASPNNACWSLDNRAAGLRVPASSPAARRVENRLPGADANPYLAIAASLAAGLHGIEQRLAPSPAVQGEMVVPDHLSLPCTLHAALERLKRSQLARELFADEFIEGYIASKTLEMASFFDEITPWERRVLAAHA